MTVALVQILLIFIVPYLIIRYKNFKFTKIFGTIGMAYFFGIVLAGLLYLLQLIGLNIKFDSDIGEIASFVAIGIGIPLLLFSANLKEAKKLSKPVVISFSALVVAVIVVASLTFIFYGKNLTDGDGLSAAAIGLYTGGTPNLNAIAAGRVDDALIPLANLADMVIGAVFYIFLLFAAKPLISKLLRKGGQVQYLTAESEMKDTENFNVKDFKTSKRLFQAFIIAFVIAAVGAAIGYLIWVLKGSPNNQMTSFVVPALMITATALGIAFSFVKKVRETKGTNVLGHYLILVFSFGIASAIDFNVLQEHFLNLIILYGIITVGSFFLHMIFAWILKIDVDCMIVCATAGIYGPAFVPAITKQIKDDSLTVPGLIVGSIGYAIGTFIGIAIAQLFALGM